MLYLQKEFTQMNKPRGELLPEMMTEFAQRHAKTKINDHVTSPL